MKNLKMFYNEAGVGRSMIERRMAKDWLASEIDQYSIFSTAGPWEARYHAGNGKLLDLRRYL